MQRRKTREIKIGNKKIGNNSPILVQSMCNTDTTDAKATIAQIKRLEKAGCEIVRVSVPDMEAAVALKEIKKNISIPLVADIHFDYRLAIAAAPYVDKLRINPGNIGSIDKVKQVVDAANKYKIPIRIGVNSGSIEKEIQEKYGYTAEALFESVKKNVKILEDLDFHNIVISAKMSDVEDTIRVYRMISKEYDYPLHVGVTEAGTLLSGSIKSSLGIGILLNEGIGDTIRVSLTDDPEREVEVAYSILQFLDIRRTKREIISCPTCSRTKVDLISIAKEVEEKTKDIKVPLKIAVMGCVVNGPGEARNADIGVACGDKQGAIFRKGKVIKTVPEERIVEELLKEIKNIK